MAVVPAFFGLLMAVIVTGQELHIEPLVAVRRVGEDLVVKCRVPYIIDSCRMTVGTTPYRLGPEITSDSVVYTGEGFNKGECGALIRNIREEWNGNITCVLPPPNGAIELVGVMRLIVARPPGEPILVTPTTSFFREDTEFSAECIVPEGRPQANITWWLGEEQILNGLQKPVITETASGLKTIRQNLTRVLSADDDGKTLECRVEHKALPSPIRRTRQLIVQYPPQRPDSASITIFGLKLGGEGLLNVTVRANPRPDAAWRVGSEQLLPPHSNQLGTIAALEPVPLGGGYYNITLRIGQISKEDVDRQYHLTASNELGAQEYALTISTLDEPVGVELDTGAIVGIVVAVLVLLIAVFLLVFAKATDRWCFAGRSHRTDIPDGADSEAPLPSHDDVKGSENPTHDHGEYISNGDTKHPEKKPDTAV